MIFDEFIKKIECLERIIAERDAHIAAQDVIIRMLTEKVKHLKIRLNINSTNSSKPSSSDPPWKPATGKGKGGGKVGGQKGHKGIARELVPIEKVSEIVTCMPPPVCSCGGSVEIDLSSHEKKQVFEIPRIEPHITEYQIFRGCCASCSKGIRGDLPVGTPDGMLGPHALATIAYFTGEFHLSKRDIEELFTNYFNLPLCVGSVCNAEQLVSEALKTPYEEAAAEIKKAKVVNADETGHRVAGKGAWMWIALTAFVAVFYARATRSKAVAKDILGENFLGILVSDRYNAYLWVTNRQICWAHLCRDFAKVALYGPEAERFANKMFEYVKEMFKLWHGYKDRHITRSEVQEMLVSLRAQMESHLESGKLVPGAETLSKSLCKLKTALWTFIDSEGVEPTNNEAERTVRQYVIWRKTSFGTQTSKGNEFVERILTVVGSCKRQNRKVIDYLTEAMTDHLHGRPVASLLPA